MIKFLAIHENEQRKIYQEISNQVGLPPQAIEKDAWVTLMLRMIFTSKLAKRFVFKGGTSLSKAFGLIQRFSEDIDLGIDRTELGFEGDLTKGEIRKLRKACHSFVSNDLLDILRQQLTDYGINSDCYKISVENTEISDQDPETIKVEYTSLFDGVSYLANRILIEVSARSLIEPNQNVQISSILDEQYPDAVFTEESFTVNATNPQKTFLEKLILLHEEFQKPEDKIRYLRMSRHFYDIGQILDSEYGKDAIQDTELFESIIAHRKVLTPTKTTNYDSLSLEKLNISPPEEQLKNYKSDYKEMQNSMIHGRSEDFGELLEKIKKSF